MEVGCLISPSVLLWDVVAIVDDLTGFSVISISFMATLMCFSLRWHHLPLSSDATSLWSNVWVSEMSECAYALVKKYVFEIIPRGRKARIFLCFITHLLRQRQQTLPGCADKFISHFYALHSVAVNNYKRSTALWRYGFLKFIHDAAYSRGRLSRSALCEFNEVSTTK